MGNIKDLEIAIIIPCKNEGIYIKQTLDFLLNTEAEYSSNIIIIDDNSNDNCCDFLKIDSPRYNNISLIQTNAIGAEQASNLGASLATSAKNLILCDAHIIMKQNWLLTILKALNDSDVSVVCPAI